MRFIYDSGNEIWLDTQHQVTDAQKKILQAGTYDGDPLKPHCQVPLEQEPDVVELCNAGLLYGFTHWHGFSKPVTCLTVELSQWGVLYLEGLITDEDPR